MAAAVTVLIAAAAALAFLAALSAVLLRVALRRAPRTGAFVVADDVRLHYVTAGPDDGPTVVFLHGAKGSVYDGLLSVAPLLAARGFRVVAFDRPGSGYSARAPRDNASPFEQAALIGEALQRLGIDRPVLVGHSTGAATALALALARPGAVAAVVTLGAYAFPARQPARGGARVLELPALGPLLQATVVVPLGLALAPAILRRVFAPGPVDRAYARTATALAIRPRHVAADAGEVPQVERGLRRLASRYPALAMPLVAVHGRQDHVLSYRQSAELCRLVAGGELVLLDGAGHMPHFTRPDDVVAAVESAWRRAGGAGPARRRRPPGPAQPRLLHP